MTVEAQENSTHQGIWRDKGEVDISLNSWTFKLQNFFSRNAILFLSSTWKIAKNCLSDPVVWTRMTSFSSFRPSNGLSIHWGQRCFFSV